MKRIFLRSNYNFYNNKRFALNFICVHLRNLRLNLPLPRPSCPTRVPPRGGSGVGPLDGPEDEVGRGGRGAEVAELGGDLAAVVGRVVDHVAEDGPERQLERLALEVAVRPGGREPGGGGRRDQGAEG